MPFRKFTKILQKLQEIQDLFCHLKRMAVIAESSLGCFIDHQQSIDSCYKLTRSKYDLLNDEKKEHIQQQREMEQSGGEPDSTSYKCKPDLFAIWQPFSMDSHFNRALKKQTTVNDKTAEEDINSISVEKSENSTEDDSSKLEIFHANYQKNLENSLEFPVLPLASSGISNELHMTLSLQQKTGTNSCNRKRKRRKQPLNVGELASLEEHMKICQLLSTALNQLRSLLIETGYDATVPVYDNNISARQAASAGGIGDLFVQCCQQAASSSFQSDELIEIKSIDCLSPDEDLCNKLIEQPHEKARLQTLMGSRFLIPPHSRFLMSDISCFELLLMDETRYDCIVIDPPWENKSVKRKKMYTTMADWEFLRLPVGHLCSRASLVIVWVTNKQRQQNFVKEHLFPKWNIKYLTKWYWLKVTKLLEPIYDLNTKGPSKRPYECMLLGSTSSSGNTFEKIPKDHIIASVPCSIHSRKPPLNEILQPYLSPNAKCLEMFARSLLPNWTSWGNEVLAFQHLDFFERCPRNTRPKTEDQFQRQYTS